jgi:4-hydroxybenzoate polyprenyltransferase
MVKKIVDLGKLFRPSQWVKNIFLFAALIFSKHFFELAYFSAAAKGFIVFCLASSIVYIINDIADREADKLHPLKRKRPLAAGTVNVASALTVAGGILILLGWLIVQLPMLFSIAVLLYMFLNLGYTFGLKRVVLVDVFIIAAGFMLRVIAGAFVIDVVISSWLALCTLFISVFLAISKRRGELLLVTEDASSSVRPVLKYYDVAFLDQLMTITAAGVVISYALYTVAERTINIFGTENLIFTTVFVLFGVFRYLFLIRAHRTDDNPMHLLLTDFPMLVNIGAWFVFCVLVIYRHEIYSRLF